MRRLAVPRYVRSEELKPVSSPEMGPAAFGGDTVVAVSKMGASFGRIADVMEAHTLKIREKKDRAKVLEITAGFNRKLNEALYGENGLLMRQGLEAHDTFRDVTGLIDEYLEDSAGLAENDNQAEAIRAYILSNRNTFESQAAKHEAMEVRKAELKEADALVGTWKETAVNSYGDPEVMETVKDNVMAIYEASLGPYGKAVVDEAFKKAMSAIHVSVLEKYLVDYDTNGARAYFDVYKEEIDFSERNTIEGKIAKGEMVTWAQEEAEKIAGKFGYDNEWTALEHIRKNYEGAKEDMLMKYVQGLYVDYRRTREKPAGGIEASVVLDNLKKIPTMSGQLAYIDSLDLTDKARTMYEKIILSGGYPSDITTEDGNALASITASMAAMPGDEIPQGVVEDLFAGRASRATLGLVLELAKMDLPTRKSISSAINEAINKYQVGLKDIPALASRLLKHDFSKGFTESDSKNYIRDLIPQKTPDTLKWKDGEIKQIVAASFKYVDKKLRDRAEAVLKDNLSKIVVRSAEEKFDLMSYFSTPIKIGSISVPGWMIPMIATIEKIVVEKGELSEESERILKRLNVLGGVEAPSAYKWQINVSGETMDLVDYLEKRGLIKGDVNPLLSQVDIDKNRAITFYDWRKLR